MFVIFFDFSKERIPIKGEKIFSLAFIAIKFPAHMKLSLIENGEIERIYGFQKVLHKLISCFFEVKKKAFFNSKIGFSSFVIPWKLKSRIREILFLCRTILDASAVSTTVFTLFPMGSGYPIWGAYGPPV